MTNLSDYEQEVYDILMRLDPDAADRYRRCGREGEGWVLTCSQMPGLHDTEYVPYSCMLRICPKCAKRLANDLRRKYERVISAVVHEQAYKLAWGWRLRMVTLTSGYEVAPEVGEELRFLLDEARDTLKAVYGDGNGMGAVAGVEAGEKGHKLHVHALVWGPYAEASMVAEEWERRTGQCNVDVRAAGGSDLARCVGRRYASGHGGYTEGEVAGVVAEALKYCVKLTSLSPGQMVDLHMAMKGRRRVRSWGSFYGHPVAQCDCDDGARLCSECGARMELIEEQSFARMFPNGEAVLVLIRANKSVSGGSPPVTAGAPPGGAVALGEVPGAVMGADPLLDVVFG